MLIKYVFQNFRSFKGKTQLDMGAGPQRTLMKPHPPKWTAYSSVVYMVQTQAENPILYVLGSDARSSCKALLRLRLRFNNLELYPLPQFDRTMLFEGSYKQDSHFLYS